MILTLGTTPAVARSMVFARLELDRVNRAASVAVAAAGKSINVARVLTTLGHQALCLGVVGGEAGQTLRHDLDTAGIPHDLTPVAAETRVCVTVIDRATAQSTELVQEAGPVSAEERQRLLSTLAAHAPDASTLVLAGTIAPGLGNHFYRECIEQARQRNPELRVIVDAKGQGLEATLDLGVIVKCNRVELADALGQLIDGDEVFEQALADLMAAGARAAVVSDGLWPTWVHDATGTWQIPTPQVPVVSPIGSGDSMAAGLAAGLERGDDLLDAARLGVACAAANAQTPIAGGIEPSEVERLLAGLKQSA